MSCTAVADQAERWPSVDVNLVRRWLLPRSGTTTTWVPSVGRRQASSSRRHHGLTASKSTLRPLTASRSTLRPPTRELRRRTAVSAAGRPPTPPPRRRRSYRRRPRPRSSTTAGRVRRGPEAAAGRTWSHCCPGTWTPSRALRSACPRASKHGRCTARTRHRRLFRRRGRREDSLTDLGTCFSSPGTPPNPQNEVYK